MIDEMVLYGKNKEFVIEFSLKHVFAVTFKSDVITISTNDEFIKIPSDLIDYHRVNKALNKELHDSDVFVLYLHGDIDDIKSKIKTTKRQILPKMDVS